MNLLLKTSFEEKLPIEIMCIATNNEITKRQIIVTCIEEKYVKAFSLTRNQKRTFKSENILAAAKPKLRRGIIYA